MTEFSHKNRKDESKASARKLWIRSDIFVIFALCTLAAIIYFVYMATEAQNGKPYFEIVLDGQVVMTDDLTENKSFSLEMLPNVVFEIKDGAIAFIESDCPDKICIHSGYLHMAGQAAACLPNKAAVRIKANGNIDAPDIVI